MFGYFVLALGQSSTKHKKQGRSWKCGLVHLDVSLGYCYCPILLKWLPPSSAVLWLSRDVVWASWQSGLKLDKVFSYQEMDSEA